MRLALYARVMQMRAMSAETMPSNRTVVALLSLLRSLLPRVLAMIAGIAFPGLCAGLAYVATPVGPLGTNSYARAMNANGDVAGMVLMWQGTTSVFLFSGGELHDLGALDLDIVGINDRLDIVGNNLHAGGRFNSYRHAFALSNGVVTDIGTLGGSNSWAYGIANDGQIVGASDVAGVAAIHAFAYFDGTMHDLGTLSGGNSTATAVNDHGDITGYSDPAFPGRPSQARAFLYTNGAMRDIGTLGGDVAYARAISAAAAITGTSMVAGNRASHAFVYSQGAMRDLGALGNPYSVGNGINSAGDVVGGAGVSSVNLQTAFAFLDGTMVDLNDLVVSGSGAAKLVTATAINDSRQILAVGCTPGYCQAYKLDPVESTPPLPPVVPVVEYYYAPFDHYFITSIPAEIGLLDSGALPGWVRTGQQFNAYATPAVGAERVCRFFSTAFAPKSSHFYTADPNECAQAAALGPWLFEGYVMYMPFPRQGTCPAGTDNVYRLYNSGQGGAPAHRYTTSSIIRAQMIEKGWVAEGQGPDQVVMCSPA